MGNRKKNQSGFNIVWVLPIVAAAGIVGIVVWSVFLHGRAKDSNIHTLSGSKPASQQSTTNSTNPSLSASSNTPGTTTGTQPSTPTQTTQQNKTYTSSQNGYSFTYPNNWRVAAISNPNNVEQIEATALTDSTPHNHFSLMFTVSSDPDATKQPAAVPNGTVTTLSNGLLTWESHKDKSYLPGPPSMYCPTISDLSNANGSYHFSYALKNGKYLTVQGGYCMYQNSAPTESYEQQLASSEWVTARSIFSSINIKK